VTQPPQTRRDQRTTTQPPNQNLSPKDYVGPFVGVRPPIEGPSLLAFNGNERYELWLYTINDLNTELNGLLTGVTTPPATPPR
jgi:hypothetical protein